MAARLVRRRPLRYGHRVPGRERHRAVLRVGLGLLAVSACKSPAEKATPAARGEVATPPSVAAKSVAEAPPVSAAPPAVPAPPSSAEPTPAPPEPRVYVKARFVWVRPTPSGEGQWLGFLWTGSSVRLKSTEPRSGPGCRTFYAIEPEGYVCVDGERATLDPNDPVYRALVPFAPRADAPQPHPFYGESIGVERYFEPPRPEHQRRRERDLAAHLADVARAREGNVSKRLTGVDLGVPTAEPPSFPPLPRRFFEPRDRLKARSTVSYSLEARFGDRGFLLSGDYAWMPKDRVIPYPKVTFHGLRLPEDAELPLAFFRGKDRPKYVRAADGSFSANGAFPRLGWVALTGKSERWNEERYLETKEAGVWVRERDAVLPQERKRTPWGAPVGGKDETGARRRKWLEIAIDEGWLLAYDGTRPVYATLMSPGRGGAARPGEDPLERAASPVGTYSINGKFVTATMVDPGELVHSDVPFAQNIVGPYAIHAAYWHDNWGRPQSGGCINLSPVDAKWLFDFTDPPMPEGWHGIRLLPSQHVPTIVVLRP